MALITIRILEGLERGRVYPNLHTPITVGREDDNTIQLNDERVSRFHAKFQDDNGRVILTDLESTNGTRVNGHAVQMHVLQPGDLVSIGRCLLLFGEPQIHDQAEGVLYETPTALSEGGHGTAGDDLDFMSQPSAFPTEDAPLFPKGTPELPDDLRPLVRAQLSDLLAYVHEQVGRISQSATEECDVTTGRFARCPWAEFQRLLHLQAELAIQLRKLANLDQA